MRLEILKDLLLILIRVDPSWFCLVIMRMLSKAFLLEVDIMRTLVSDGLRKFCHSLNIKNHIFHSICQENEDLLKVKSIKHDY